MTGIGFSRQREQMVELQIARRGVRDPRVLAAMCEVPRERFVGPGSAEFAYADSPLPIEAGQTISQPYVVAMMVEAAELKPGDVALEIGAGSGYAAAVISRISARLYTIERHETLARLARERLSALGYDNVEVVQGDGTGGLPDRAPFDAILVAAGAPVVPQALKDQLRIGGRLIMPVGEAERQTLCRITRRSATRYDEDRLGTVLFVPLVSGRARLERADARTR